MTDHGVAALVGAILGVSPSDLRTDDGMHRIPQWDSFAQVEIVDQIERLTGSPVPDELAFEELATIRGIVDYLKESDN